MTRPGDLPVHLYVLRVDDPRTRPDYIGPLTHHQAEDLGQRLAKAGRTYEYGYLVTEAQLPGLFDSQPE